MPRQRIDHGGIVYVMPDDFPARLVRFKEESGLSRSEIERRLDVHPETTKPRGGGVHRQRPDQQAGWQTGGQGDVAHAAEIFHPKHSTRTKPESEGRPSTNAQGKAGAGVFGGPPAVPRR